MKAMPDLLSRLHPWQQGAMVKKSSSPMTQAKEIRQVQLSQTSIERLRRLKEQSGMMQWNEGLIRKGLEELSINIKRRVMLWKELDAECFDLDHPMVKQEVTPNPPVLYKTMRLQTPLQPQTVKQEQMEELLKTILTPFQSQTQQHSPSLIQHPFQSQTPPTMPSRERAWRNKMPN